MVVSTKLTVQFSENNFATYKTTNVIYSCVTLTTCSHWEPAVSISWENLSKKKFAMFYETDTCRTGLKFYYISDVAKVNGTHSFPTPQAIRSFMIGTDDYGRRPSMISNACRSDYERTTVDMNDTSLDVSYQIKWSTEGSISSNWTYDLPETATV